MSGPGVGFEYPPQEVSWLKRDVLLFANSIGATADELHFLYELHPNFQVFPTYPIILPFKHTDQEVIDFYARSSATPIPGVPKLDPRRVVDGQRSITFLKPLPPTSAGKTFEIRSKVLGVYDKGKPGTVVETEQLLVEKGGDVYARAVGSGFFVGQGNWGGPKGPATVNYPPPEGKKPDAVHTLQTKKESALLYRLNGDYNPLHATPEPGQKMGFGGAIMHGLFSWNSACHGLLQLLGGSDPANIREFQARFAAPVIPGDKLVTEMWRTGDIKDGWEENTAAAVDAKQSERLPSHVGPRPSITVSAGDRAISVSWKDGQNSTYHSFWLRDHCQCKYCQHEETRQRLVNTFAIPKDLHAQSLHYGDDGLHITWSDGGHKSFYDWNWLQSHGIKGDLTGDSLTGDGLTAGNGQKSFDLVQWGSEIKKSPPTVSYQDVMASEEGVKYWTSKIRQYGFCYVDGCPPTPEATQKLLERIAFIRVTHYGGFWDFTSDLSLKDTAYTSLALGAHTDTTYFTDPAGLQMFHLLSHTEGEGGASLLVDGFRAAAILKEQSPEAYDLLRSTPVPTHSSGNEGISVQPSTPRPVLNEHPVTGELYQVRWNNDDRATMDQWSNLDDIDRWYRAARMWARILRSETSEYWEQLKPGRPLIFDNWRVLHGRSAFTGKRRMCGGYINHDDFMSRYRMTNFSREEVLRKL